MTRAQNGVFWEIQAHTSRHINQRARRRARGAAGGVPQGGRAGPGLSWGCATLRGRKGCQGFPVVPPGAWGRRCRPNVRQG